MDEGRERRGGKGYCIDTKCIAYGFRMLRGVSVDREEKKN